MADFVFRPEDVHDWNGCPTGHEDHPWIRPDQIGLLHGSMQWAVMRFLWRKGPSGTGAIKRSTGSTGVIALLRTLHDKGLVDFWLDLAFAVVQLPDTLSADKLPLDHRAGRARLAQHLTGFRTRQELERTAGMNARSIRQSLPDTDPTAALKRDLQRAGLKSPEMGHALLRTYGAPAVRDCLQSMRQAQKGGTKIHSPVHYLTRCLENHRENPIPRRERPAKPDLDSDGESPPVPYRGSSRSGEDKNKNKTVAVSDLAKAWMEKTGSSQANATRLIRDCGPQRVQAQLDCMDQYLRLYAAAGQTIRDLTGFMAAAVRRGYVPDPDLLQPIHRPPNDHTPAPPKTSRPEPKPLAPSEWPARPTWTQVRAWWLNAAEHLENAAAAAQLKCLDWDPEGKRVKLQAPSSLPWDWVELIAPALGNALRTHLHPDWEVLVQDAAPEEDTDPDTVGLSYLQRYAQSQGVHGGLVATRLQQDPMSVQRQLLWWPDRLARYTTEVENPAALLTSALQGDWDAPA